MATRKGKGKSACLFCFLLIIALLPLSFARAQEPAQSTQGQQFETLLKEMNSALQSGGEEGLRAWVRANKSRIGGDFISYVAEGAGKPQTEESLRTARLIASEKGDQEALADVLYSMGRYYSNLSRNKEALDNFEAAEPLYVQLKNVVGQGNVYLNEGNIYYHTGENAKALAQYEKALPFFVAARDPIGQSNVYKAEGDVYSRTGENAKALAMYEKARALLRRGPEPYRPGQRVPR
jgi:tetratricopeptide (TPR) repeat protein